MTPEQEAKLDKISKMIDDLQDPESQVVKNVADAAMTAMYTPLEIIDLTDIYTPFADLHHENTDPA